MSPLLILQSLFILFTTLSQSKRQHKCTHNHARENIDLHETHVNYKNHPYDTHITDIKDPHKRRLSTTQPSPLRIRPYYDPNYISVEKGLTIDQINYIKSLISAATRFYTETVSVIPVENNLFIHRKCTSSYPTEFGTNCVKYLKPDQCGMVDIPSDHMDEDLLYFYPDNTTATKLPAGTGMPDTDLVIYVSYGQTQSCGEATLAWAAPCFQDQYGRPIAGTVNICPYIFEEDQFWKQDVVVLLHEITHVVIMGPELWQHFRDINGNIIPHSNIVSDTQNDGLIYITSPLVTSFAQSHFGCDILIGFPLENTGSGGSAGSHWDEHYGMSEVMGSTIWGGLHYFSNLTLSIMADSGWYYINYKYSQPFYWGKNAGCDFFISECVDWQTSASNWPQYFCNAANDNGCFYNYQAPAECEFYYHNSDLPWYLQYFKDTKTGGPEASDYCPFRDPSTQINFENACWDIRGNDDNYFKLKYTNEKYGSNSRCVDIVSNNNNGLNTKEGRCFEHQCFGYDINNMQWWGVEIYLSSNEHINCTRDEQPNGITMTNKYSNTLDLYIKCPNIDAICGSESKPFECYWGDYKDLYNECICAPGYNDMYCDKEDRSIDILNEIPINLNELITKLPTVSPTEPISDILCVENFSILELNDIYIYDGIWNFYPRYKSPNNNKYLFWNIFTHWWMIYDEFDTMYYWALCNISEWNNDINACNGEWKIYQKDISETVREINAKTYYGLCNNNIDITTTTTTAQQPIITSATSDIVIKETETNVLPSVITTSVPTITTVRPSRYPTTPHPIRTIAPHPTVTVSSIPSVSVTTGKGDIGIDSLEILNTKKNENDISQEITNIITTDEEEDVFNEFMTSDFNGISDLKTKNTLKKWAEIDWVNFFFEGYIGWIFVSVLALIILLLICVVSSMTNCKICQRDYDYIGIDFAGGSPNYNNKTKTTNMGLNGKEDEIIVTDEYDDDDDDDDDEYNDEYNDEENESDIIDDTDGETDENIGGETDEDVQTITSDLL